jgi:cytochrome c-type biogenesis protein CcmE
MKRRQRRLVLFAVCALSLGGATALVLSAFSDNIVFFLGPSDVARQAPPHGRTFRLGGMVEEGSVHRDVEDGRPVVTFRVTDKSHAIAVRYSGVLPDLFREGQGVVALGTLGADGGFVASEVLAKHDETYMPRDVAETLKREGHWDPGQGAPPPSESWSLLTGRK